MGRRSVWEAAAKARSSSSVQRWGPAGANATWTRPSRPSQSFTSRRWKSTIAFTDGGAPSSRARSAAGRIASMNGMVWVKGRFQIMGAAQTRSPTSR
jgi:hypothetical protein